MSEDSKRFTPVPTLYAVMYPELVKIARKYGYALAIHGSMVRDFDLIAVPWIEDAAENPFEMIEEMKVAISGVYSHHDIDYLLTEGNKTEKPHGRICYSIHLTDKGAFGPYLDISIMPVNKINKNYLTIDNHTA